MSDIVERLRICANTYGELRQKTVIVLLLEAAAEIDRLRTDLEVERKKHEWLTVEEKLPRNEKGVIAVDKDGYYYPQARLSDGTWEWAYEAGTDYWVDIDEPVTHWMPLPDPPKGE